MKLPSLLLVLLMSLGGCASVGTVYFGEDNPANSGDAVYNISVRESAETERYIAEFYSVDGKLYQTSEALNNNPKRLRLTGTLNRFSPEGDLTLEGYLDEDGRRHGKFIAYENNIRQWQAVYEHGFRKHLINYEDCGCCYDQLISVKQDDGLVRHTRHNGNRTDEQSILETWAERDGKKEGTHEEFTISGTPFRTSNYKGGVLHGPQFAFHNRNQVFSEKTYVKGVITGTAKLFYRDGGLRHITVYDDAGNELQEEYYHSGSDNNIRSRVTTEPDGTVIEKDYNHSGVLWRKRKTPPEDGRSKRNQCSELEEYYTSSGNLRKLERNCENEAFYILEEYDSQGALETRVETLNGQKQGLQVETENWTTTSINYRDGRKHGSYRRESEGQVLESGQYDNETRTGKWISLEGPNRRRILMVQHYNAEEQLHGAYSRKTQDGETVFTDGNYANGLKQGFWTEQPDQSRNAIGQGHYQDDVKQGQWLYRGGMLTPWETGFYIDGQRDGYWYRFRGDGRVSEKQLYSNGEPSGEPQNVYVLQ